MAGRHSSGRGPITMSRLLLSSALGALLLLSVGTQSSSANPSEHEGGPDHRRHPCRFDVTDLGSLGGSLTFASAINDRGQVAGASTLATGEQRAFRWENGVMTEVSAFAGSPAGAGSASVPAAMNRRGQIVGFSG